MSIGELLRYLKCLRCGTRENLTFYTYSKDYKYKTGGPTIYTVHKGTDSLKTPLCYDCLHKIKRWKLYLYLTVGLLILAEVIFFFIFYNIGSYFFNYFLGGGVYLGMVFASPIIFLLANNKNLGNYVSFTNHIPYVRPIKSNKWIPFKNWAKITMEGNAIQPLIKEPINPLVWKFPLIGGIICLISIITPTQIVLYNDGILRLDWIPVLTFISEVEIWDYAYGAQTIPVFLFQFTSFFLSPFTFLSIITYIVVLGGAFVIINKAYILKRAGHSITSINNIHLAWGIILIVFISIFLYLNFPVDSSIKTSILSSGVYGVFAGGIITLLGPIIQRNKKMR